MGCQLREKRGQLKAMASLLKNIGVVTIPMITSLGIAAASTAGARLRALRSEGLVVSDGWISTRGNPTRWRLADGVTHKDLDDYVEIMDKRNAQKGRMEMSDKEIISVIKSGNVFSVFDIRKITWAGYQRINRIIDYAIMDGEIVSLPEKPGKNVVNRQSNNQRKKPLDNDSEHAEWMRRWAEHKTKKDALKKSALARV